MQNRGNRSNRQGQRGSAMVESAFIFVTLAMMLIGIFDFGQFLFIHQALVERARSAIRWGAVNDPSDTTAIKNMVLYNQSTVPVSEYSVVPAGYFNLGSSNVVVTNPFPGTDQHRLEIRIVNFSYPTISPWLYGTRTTPEIRVSFALGMFN